MRLGDGSLVEEISKRDDLGAQCRTVRLVEPGTSHQGTNELNWREERINSMSS